MLAHLALAAQAAAQVDISVSGNPAPLIINSAIAGSAPIAVSNNSTTYSVSRGLLTLTTQKITAKLSTATPAGVTLRITLAAPSGATSMGAVTLTTTAQDVVRGIDIGTFYNLTITYQLSATTAAGVVSSRRPTVTLAVTSQ